MITAWQRCLERLQAELPVEEYLTWLKPLQAHGDDNSLVLYAPNQFVADTVRERHLERLNELLPHFAGGNPTLRIAVGAVSRPVVASSPSAPSSAKRVAEGANGGRSGLDPHYRFDTFVEGKSNQMGRSAAMQVAQNPGRAFNPLLLYGGTGLGKTHLMHAAGNLMRENNPAMRVLYLRSEQFFNAMMQALREKSMDRFKQQFHSVDALLIDDIQFFAGKNTTQEEFFHTFNALFEGKQQIILTCDRYPREVDNLEPRLKSRLGWGLSVAIEPPDFETRAAILLTRPSSAASTCPRTWRISSPNACARTSATSKARSIRSQHRPTSLVAISARSSPRKPCAICCACSRRRPRSRTSRRPWQTTTSCGWRSCHPSVAAVPSRDRGRSPWRWPRN